MPDINEPTWTGERYLPYLEIGEIHYEHLHRYFLASKFVKNKKVLDLGCGEGYGCSIFSLNAKHVIGVDNDQSTIVYAKKKYTNNNLTFVQGSISDIPIKENNSFDVITCFEALEHVKDQEKVIFEIKRLLKKDGILIISTPNKDEFSDENRSPFHKKELNFEEFKKLLEKKFSFVRFYGQNIFLGSNIWEYAPAKNLNEFVINRKKNEYKLSTRGNKSSKFFLAIASSKELENDFSISSFLIDDKNLLLEKKENSIQELQGFIRKKEFEIEKLKQLEIKLKETEVYLDESIKSFSEKQNHITNLEEILRDRENHIQNLEEAFKKKDVDLEELTKEVKRKDIDLGMLNKDVKKKDVDLDALNNLVRQKDVDLDALDNLVRQKDVDLDALDNLVRQKDVDLEESSKLVKQKHIESKKLSNLVIQKTIALEESSKLVKQKDTESDKLSKLVRQKSIDLEELNTLIKQKDVEIQEFLRLVPLEEEELTELNNIVKQKQEEINEFLRLVPLDEEELQELNKLLIQRDVDIKELLKLVPLEEEEIEELNSILRRKNVEVGKLSEIINHRSSELADLKSEFSEIQQSLIFQIMRKISRKIDSSFPNNSKRGEFKKVSVASFRYIQQEGLKKYLSAVKKQVSRGEIKLIDATYSLSGYMPMTLSENDKVAIIKTVQNNRKKRLKIEPHSYAETNNDGFLIFEDDKIINGD